MSVPSREDITGFVLAGGQSRRMGGVNKALVDHGGQPLYRYAVENLSACCDTILINTNRDQSVFREAGFSVVEDREFLDCGPVAGVYTALSEANTPYVAIAACDQLALPALVYQTLTHEVSHQAGVYACSKQDEIPTCAVLPISLKSGAFEMLTNSQRALMAFMRQNARPVRFDHVDFANVNETRQVRRP